MSKKVLNIGQCAFDHGGISEVISNLGYQTIKIDLHRDVSDAIKEHNPALILVNRLNDSDGSSGLRLIKELRSNPEFSNIPIMLVSNYSDAQKEAVQYGAIEGFGKSSLYAKDTTLKLKAALHI